MSYIGLTTPCPVPAASNLPGTASRAFEPGPFDENTTDVDFTRVLQHTFRNARPRRPKRPGKPPAGFDVLEDVIESKDSAAARKPMDRSEGKPLPRKPVRKDAVNIGCARLLAGTRPAASNSEGQSERQSLTPGDGAVQTGGLREDGGKPIDKARKDMRRRTIFVPSDDTTIMTIHPGANATHRLDDTFHIQGFVSHQPRHGDVPKPSRSQHQAPQAHRPRLSLAAPPKRIPLQQTESIGNNIMGVDVPGRNTGKENLLPKVVEPGPKHFSSVRLRLATKCHGSGPTSRSQASRTTVIRGASAVERQPSTLTQTVGAMHGLSVSSRTSTAVPRMAKVSAPSRPKATARAFNPRRSGDSAPSLHTFDRSNNVDVADVARFKLQKYAVLTEDVQPELYEDSWLGDQEVALTQVLNQLLSDAESTSVELVDQGDPLRARLMGIYHSPEVTTLHRRLHASLLYGALNAPKRLENVPDLTQDLGLRRRFLSLWIDSFQTEMLSTAAEVVVGRRLLSSSVNPPTPMKACERLLDPYHCRRDLIDFLETFFVSVDDTTIDEWTEGQDQHTRRRQKTILRSFMLIWLLDQAMVSSHGHRCLFKRQSSHKSLVSVLQAVSAMLLPSFGDITRTMRLMEYTLSYSQDPLDEVQYKINNLAVDLRDGIFLARLVELLLFFQRSSGPVNFKPNGNAATEVTLPDLTFIKTCDENGSPHQRPLSRHLKLPCLSRVQKVFNVQVALSALCSDDRTKTAVPPNVTATDIVDGHREKTMELLWSIVSTVGLEVLVDWGQLIADSERASDKAKASGNALPVPKLEHPGYSERETQVLRWAAAYCWLKAISVTNLTTSFADGRAYLAVIAAFNTFTTRKETPDDGDEAALHSQLHDAGCSNAFIGHLNSTRIAIPTRAATVANLVFLASRLLPMARRRNAAEVIQGAYRHRLSRVMIRRRVVMMRLAGECARVVQTEQRIVSAAVALQRAWRSVVARRADRSGGAVETFQSLARGWAVREQMTGGTVQSKGIMGGW